MLDPFSQEDLENILDELDAARVSGKPPCSRDFHTCEMLQDIGGSYVAVREYVRGSPISRTKRKAHLRKLVKSIERLIASKPANAVQLAAADIELTEWNSIGKRTDFSGVFKENWIQSISGNQKPFDEMLFAPLHQTLIGATRLLDQLERSEGKRGPKGKRDIMHAVRELAEFYESHTGRKATANFSQHKGHKTGPYVRFVQVVLKKLDTNIGERELGELVSNELS